MYNRDCLDEFFYHILPSVLNIRKNNFLDLLNKTYIVKIHILFNKIINLYFAYIQNRSSI
jgi:hypothetical protein